MATFSQLRVLPFKVDKIAQTTEHGRPRLDIKGWASTVEEDRSGEIIEVGFFDASIPKFLENPVMLWMHDRDEPQGRWEKITPVPGRGYYIEGYMVDLGGDDDKRRIAAVEEGLVKSLSVGFNGWYSPEYGYWDNETDLWHWTQNGVLLEVSPCTIPCNGSAFIDYAKSMGLDGPQKQTGILALDDLAKALEPYKLTITDEAGAAQWEGVAVAMATILGARGGKDVPEINRKALYGSLLKVYAELGKQAPAFAGEWPENAKAVTFHAGELDLLEAQVVGENITRLDGTIQSVANITRHWSKSGGGPSASMVDAAVSSITAGADITKAGRVLSEANRAAIMAAMTSLQEVLDAADSITDAAPKAAPAVMDASLWLLLNTS